MASNSQAQSISLLVKDKYCRQKKKGISCLDSHCCHCILEVYYKLGNLRYHFQPIFNRQSRGNFKTSLKYFLFCFYFILFPWCCISNEMSKELYACCSLAHAWYMVVISPEWNIVQSSALLGISKEHCGCCLAQGLGDYTTHLHPLLSSQHRSNT